MLGNFNQLKQHHKVIFAVIIGFAVVAFWRGVWGLLDFIGEMLFPSEELFIFDVILSIVGGLTILVATHYTIKVLI